MKTIKLDDFKNYNFLSNLTLSEDGKYAAYIVSRIDMEENTYKNTISFNFCEFKVLKKLFKVELTKPTLSRIFVQA